MYSDSVFSTHNARLEVQAHSFSAVKGISALSHFGTVILCYILGFLHSDPGEMAKMKKEKTKSQKIITFYYIRPLHFHSVTRQHKGRETPLTACNEFVFARK